MLGPFNSGTFFLAFPPSGNTSLRPLSVSWVLVLCGLSPLRSITLPVERIDVLLALLCRLSLVRSTTLLDERIDVLLVLLLTCETVLATD